MFGFIINRIQREDPLAPRIEKLAVLSTKATVEGMDPARLAQMSQDQGYQFGLWLERAADPDFIMGMLAGISAADAEEE